MTLCCAGPARKLVSPRATIKTTAQRTRPPSCPRHRQGGSRSITRCLESACAIAASAPAVAGVPANAFFRSPPETTGLARPPSGRRPSSRRASILSMISPVGSACGYKIGSADGLARSGSSKFTVSLKGGPWRAGSAVTATDGADANAALRGSPPFRSYWRRTRGPGAI